MSDIIGQATTQLARETARCATCAHWRPASNGDFRAKFGGGICHSRDVGEEAQYEASSMVYPYLEGGSLWTGPEFGCVQHTPAAVDQPTVPATLSP